MNNLPKVQKKKKATKLNGFTLYAKELTGYKVQPGDENVFVTPREIEKAKHSWNLLPEEEKESYKDRAKNLNVKIPGNSARFNSIGENLQEVEEKKQKLQESVTKRKDEIQAMIRDASDLGALDTKRFIFVSTLDFYRDSHTIYPAEIAFAKFSLKEGVIDATSIRINPGRLPMGSRHEAETHAKETHKYPLPDSPGAEGETDYIEICLKIITFLKSENYMPVFFTEGNPDVSNQIHVIENTANILKLIFQKAGEYEASYELKVYPIDELLFYLIKQIEEIRKIQDEDTEDFEVFQSIQHAHDKFQRADNLWAYNGNLSCDYHYEKDATTHCCLSRVKRYGYVITKYCCEKEKYEIKEGHHFPKNENTPRSV